MATAELYLTLMAVCERASIIYQLKQAENLFFSYLASSLLSLIPSPNNPSFPSLS